MCRVSHTNSKKGRSPSINSLVVGIGTCERTDCRKGSMATQWELPMWQMLVCACVAWVCGLCVCACMAAVQLICDLCNVLTLELNGLVCVPLWSGTLHGVCVYVCVCMRVPICYAWLSEWMLIVLCTTSWCVCVLVISNYACLCMVCVCMCVISSYACLVKRETMLTCR